MGSAGVLSAVLLLSAAAVVRAADGGGALADAALDEIVVTAQRRSQSVQDVGEAVTAVSGEGLQALRIAQPLGLAALSPSLSTMNATTDSTPLFLIRGIGLDDFNMNNSSTTSHVIPTFST